MLKLAKMHTKSLQTSLRGFIVHNENRLESGISRSNPVEILWLDWSLAGGFMLETSVSGMQETRHYSA